MNQKTPYPVNVLVPVFLVLMFGVPIALACAPIFLVEPVWAKIMLTALSPFVFAASFVLISGVLSWPFHRAIIPGKFPRDVSHVVYGPRRLYGLSWCSLFYFTPLYFAVTSVPQLRRLTFWLFGYRGHSDITVAPDAWIRDLPRLNFSRGVYTANKCTIGTNMCLSNGSILVDTVTLGERTMVGHLAMVAPGCRLGDNAEVGVGCAIGIRAQIGNRTRIAPTSSINHGAQIGDDVEIGAMCYIGLKSRIGSGVKIPSGTNVPEGMEIRDSGALSSLLQREGAELNREKERLEAIFSSRVQRYRQPA